MAFTFRVEDGTGVADATSYVSVEDADDIVSVNIHADDKWGLLSPGKKEKLLSWASRYLDVQTKWHGRRVSGSSGLRWPREGVCDRDGLELPSTEIPRQLKIATASMATFLMDTDRSAERDQDAIKMIKADVVEIEFVEGYRLPKVPQHMHNLIEGLGIISSGRPKFKRIIK